MALFINNMSLDHDIANENIQIMYMSHHILSFYHIFRLTNSY